MVGKNVSEHCDFFVSFKVVQVNTCGREGCVGWGEDRERTFSLECRHQVGLGERSNEAVVVACFLGVGGDIFGLVCRYIKRCDGD